MKTSLGIWAFGGMATRFNPGGYKPELAGVSTVQKVRTAVEGLGDLMDDYEFHYPQELSRENL
jgi:xylose isomerase